MSFRDAIQPQMEVLTSDGVVVGRVGSIVGDQIALTQSGQQASGHNRVPLHLVGRVDSDVHLTATSAGLASALAGAGAGAGAAHAGSATPARPASPTTPADEPLEGPLPPVRNPAVGNARPRGNYYLPWVLGALLLLLLLFGLLRGCDPADERVEDRPVVPQSTEERREETATGRYASGTIAYELDRFLASDEPPPRTLSFEKLNFDTGSAAVRPEDVVDLDQIAQVMNTHPRSRIAIIGYTDARGSGRANARLGEERAEAIAEGLVTRGIAADRLEARSGGEREPTANNRSAEGQAENRRTELIVLSR
ncbi:MAG TPA: OmpA family protein [Allosphingosinicella sp.]|nr:OmpA family protein [Allosphingosinicella sp.]